MLIVCVYVWDYVCVCAVKLNVYAHTHVHVFIRCVICMRYTASALKSNALQHAAACILLLCIEGSIL